MQSRMLLAFSRLAIVFIFSLLYLSSGWTAEELIVSGKIFYSSQDESAPKLSYLYEKKAKEENGLRKVRAAYKDLDGKELIFEEYEYQSGELIRYTYNQLQTKEYGVAEIKGKKVFFSFTSRDKKTTSTMDTEANMISADGLQNLIQKEWAALSKEETVKFRFLLTEIKDTVGFKLFKQKEIKWKGIDAVEFKMKPSSIFIAAVVSPLYFITEKNEPHRILFSRGRMPIRRAIFDPPTNPDHWRAIDAEIEMSYGDSGSSSSKSSSGSAKSGAGK